MAWYDDYGDAWNSRDSGRITSFMTEDAVYEDIPLDEHHQGHAAITSFIDRMSGEFSSDYSFDFADPISISDDGYAIEWVMHGTHDGPNGPVPPTGKSVEIHGVSVGRLEGGKIKHNRDYWSLGEFLMQIGVLPPMGENAPAS
jgi:steroid delta-isomerase-like uncharacterized protein